MVASLDQVVSQEAGDNRLAVFDWTGLSALNSPGCFACGGIQFGGQLLTSGETYFDQGLACPASQAGVPGLDALGYPNTWCGLGPQEAGPIPLGDACVSIGLAAGVTSCPESGIATNADFISQAFYSQGEVWTAVNTIVVQEFQHGSSEDHLGVAYWGVNTDFSHHGAPDFSFAAQGYVSAAHEDLEFPSLAATQGSVLMAFTLSGNGGPTGADNGGFYPSTAYVMLSNGWFGFGQNTIHISALGQSPQDGFTEYQGYSATYGTLTTRPRWGDYSQATFDPSTGKFVFASEMIQAPKCSDSTFSADPTCGGTRAQQANWGSSINSIFP